MYGTKLTFIEFELGKVEELKVAHWGTVTDAGEHDKQWGGTMSGGEPEAQYGIVAATATTGEEWLVATEQLAEGGCEHCDICLG